jgi:hypothetical protein
MERFFVEYFVRVVADIETLRVLTNRSGPQAEDDVPTELAPQLLFRIKAIADYLTAIGFFGPFFQCARIREHLELPVLPKLNWLSERMQDLKDRVEDEAKARLFFIIPPAKYAYYAQPESWGEEVYKAFPDAVYDIDEAGKCFAVGRHTACVYHLSRLMERVLRAAVNQLGGDGAKPSWDALLKEMARQVERIDADIALAWNAEGKEFKSDDARYYSELAKDFRAIKTAWRNPGMHVDGLFDEDRAKDIYAAVQLFTKQVARRGALPASLPVEGTP